MALVFSNPALADLLNRHGIQVVAFLSPMPNDYHQSCLLQQRQMLGDRLTCHFEVLAQFIQRQSIVLVKPVKQMPAARISQRFENDIQRNKLMQP